MVCRVVCLRGGGGGQQEEADSRMPVGHLRKEAWKEQGLVRCLGPRNSPEEGQRGQWGVSPSDATSHSRKSELGVSMAASVHSLPCTNLFSPQLREQLLPSSHWPLFLGGT